MATDDTINIDVRKILNFGLPGLAALVVGIWLILGFYSVRPGEAAALQTFGAAHAQPVSQEGLHWHYPSPIGRTTVVHVQKVRVSEVGFHTVPDDKISPVTNQGWQSDLGQATMITGDLSLIEAQLVVQYRIKNLHEYLFGADDPGITLLYLTTEDANKVLTKQTHPEGYPDGKTLKDAIEVSMRRAMGQRTIDQAMITERETIEAETLEYAQDILDSYETGLQLISVQLQEVKAPDAVQEAFDDVLRAREEKDKRINEALAFRSKVLPEARGTAQRLLREAEAYRAERIAASQGEANRFLAIHEEYQAAPEIISERMYLEMMDTVMPRMKKVFIPKGSQPIILTETSDSKLPIVIPGE